MHNFSKSSYIEVYDEFEKACDWLASCGVHYSKSRINKYKEILAKLAEAQKSNSLFDIRDDIKFVEFVNSAQEAEEVISIYRGLSQINSDLFQDRLVKILKGTEFRVDELHNSHGRDIAFELLVAAKFANSGFPVDFGTEADLKVEYKNVTLFVECKRIKSRKKVQRRIKEALKQLHKRYKTASDPSFSKGLLSLSIGNIINPDMKLLTGKTAIDVGEMAAKYNAWFIEKYKKYLHNTKDKRTIGSIVVFTTPSVITDENLLTRCSQVSLNNSCDKDSIDYLWLTDIADNVFSKV